MASELKNISIRQYTQDDYPFVKSSWIKQQKKCSTFIKVQSKIFFNLYSKYLDDLIERSDIWIACDSDHSTQTFGYIAIGPDCLHYIYVKGIYRGLGISNLLLETIVDPCLVYTHVSSNPAFKEMMNRMNLTYCPYFLLRGNKI